MSEESASGITTLRTQVQSEFGELYHVYYSEKFGALRLKGPTNVDPIEADTAEQLLERIRDDYRRYAAMQDTGLDWKPSPTSNPSGNCPRYADLPDGGKALGNDRDPSAVVRYDAGEWAALKEDIISGQIR